MKYMLKSLNNKLKLIDKEKLMKNMIKLLMLKELEFHNLNKICNK
jgi:hypothetical protein